MRRRPFLATVGASIVGSVGGCLSSGGGYETLPEGYEPPAGHHQAGYDARNSNYAAGLTGPTSTPTNHRIHSGAGGTPLTTEEAMFTSTWSAGLDLEPRWDVPPPVEGGKLYPALHGDSVVTVGRGQDDDRAQVAWALSQADGAEQWRTPLTGQPAFGSLTVLDDAGYFPTKDGVGSVDLSAQEEAWQTDLTADHPHVVNPFYWLTPAATPDHVFVLNQGPAHPDYDGPRLLYALHRDSGELDWTADLEFGPREGLNVGGPVVGDRYVFVTAQVDKDPTGGPNDDPWVRTTAIDPADGEIAWSEDLQGKNDSTPGAAVADGQFYVPHGATDDDPPLFSALDTADGSVEWTTEIPSYIIRPTVTDDLVYVVDMAAHCTAIDPDDGSVAWQVYIPDLEGAPPLRAWEGPSPPIVLDERMFVDMGEGELLELW